MKKLNILILTLSLFFVLSCNKYKIDVDNLPSWSSDWLIPILKGKFEFETIKELNQSETSFDVPSVDIGFASGTTINVPSFTLSEVGPYAQPFGEWIHAIHFDSLEIKLTFRNVFPIAIGAGTQFSFRREADINDPSNLIYQHTISADILPNEEYSFSIVINDNFISDTTFLYLEQFNSPGGNNVTFSTTPCTIDIALQVIDINRVELNTNKSLSVHDTLEINLANDSNTLDDSSNQAVINVFFENAFPINQKVQIYFLDASSNLITDSLFDMPLVSLGSTNDAQGNPITTTKNQTSVTISKSSVQKIQQSKKAILSYDMNTNGYSTPTVVANDKTYFDIQLTGDLHVSFKLKSN